MIDLSRERSFLTTALVGATLAPGVPASHMVRSWLDSWSGAGHVRWVFSVVHAGVTVEPARRPDQAWMC